MRSHAARTRNRLSLLDRSRAGGCARLSLPILTTGLAAGTCHGRYEIGARFSLARRTRNDHPACPAGEVRGRDGRFRLHGLGGSRADVHVEPRTSPVCRGSIHDVAPPATDADIRAVEHALGRTIPAPLRTFFARGASGLDCGYTMQPEGQALDRLRDVLPDVSRIYGGARLGPVSELADFSRAVREWADETWVAESPRSVSSGIPLFPLSGSLTGTTWLRSPNDQTDPPSSTSVTMTRVSSRSKPRRISEPGSGCVTSGPSIGC